MTYIWNKELNVKFKSKIPFLLIWLFSNSWSNFDRDMKDNGEVTLCAKNSIGEFRINRRQQDSGFNRECLKLFCISNWKARRKNRLVENGKKVERDIGLNGVTWGSKKSCENRNFYTKRQNHRQDVANLIYRQ